MNSLKTSLRSTRREGILQGKVEMWMEQRGLGGELQMERGVPRFVYLFPLVCSYMHFILIRFHGTSSQLKPTPSIHLGTVVKKKRGGKLLADLCRPGDEVVVAQGGRGGVSILSQDVGKPKNRLPGVPAGVSVVHSPDEKVR